MTKYGKQKRAENEKLSVYGLSFLLTVPLEISVPVTVDSGQRERTLKIPDEAM